MRNGSKSVLRHSGNTSQQGGLTSYTHCKQYCVIGNFTLDKKQVFSSLGLCHFQNDHGYNSSAKQERELVTLENV